MALNGAVHQDGFRYYLVADPTSPATTPLTIPAAGTYVYTIPTSSLQIPLAGMNYLGAEAQFVRAAGGTTLKVYIQTSFDGGLTWVDVICIAFATTTANKMSAVSTSIPSATPVIAIAASDGALADDATVQGILGTLVRAKVIVAGTYTGASTIRVDIVAKG